MKTFTGFLFLLFLTLSTEASSGALDRIAAKKILLQDENFQIVYIKTSALCESKSGSLLIQNNYAIEPSGYHNLDIQPLAKLMPFFGGYVNDQLIGRSVSLLYGEIEDVVVDGIAPIDNFNNMVKFSLIIKTNEIGEILGNLTTIPLVTQYRLYDDGWRYEDILWKETKKLSSESLIELHGFRNKENALNSALWNMHEMKLYPENYSEYLNILEKSDSFEYLDTVA